MATESDNLGLKTRLSIVRIGELWSCAYDQLLTL